MVERRSQHRSFPASRETSKMEALSCRARHGAAVLLVTLGVAAPPLSGQTIRGYLVDADNGAPIELATLTLLTTNGDAIDTAVTDTEGAFSLEGSSPGSFLLRASAWGYGDRVDGVFELGDGGRMDVEVRMAPPLPVHARRARASVPQPLRVG